jgi:hypothetical protein
LQSLPEHRYANLSVRVIRSHTHEHTDPRNLPALLRPRGIGHMTVVPLRRVMNSRRLIAAPEGQDEPS